MTDAVVTKVIDLYTTKTQALFDESRGGSLRSVKGTLVEDMAKIMVRAAWANLGGDATRLSFGGEGQKKKIRIPIKPENVDSFPEIVKAEIKRHAESFYYDVGVDLHIHIDGAFVFGIECKAYTENAMLKRILTDFMLMKKIYPDLKCCLLQLETFLGGSNTDPDPSISKIANVSTYTLMSYFPTVDLKILTLLEGARGLQNPIHKATGFKAMRPDYVHSAIQQIQMQMAVFA